MVRVYMIVICSILILTLFSIDQVAALDEWKNKIEAETSIELPESKRKIGLVTSHEEVYDLNADKLTAYKYGLELSTLLTKHIDFALEYKYIDNKHKQDGEEIESNFIFKYKLPLKAELKDENKLITDIRKGNYAYKNEFELCREIIKLSEFQAVSLLLADILIYDFEESRWTENEVNFGIEISLTQLLKLEIKYCHIDVLDDPGSSEKIESKLTYSF